MKTLKVWMKHTGSCLPDGGYDVEVDEYRRRVIVRSASFNSALFARLVTSVLPEDLGVIAYRDDNLGWITPPAPYGIEVHFGGQCFNARVVKLMNLAGSGGVATHLELTSCSGEPPSRSGRVS